MSKDVYIPKNLDDALNHLLETMDEDSINTIKESKNMSMFHFTTGMAMRNSWGLWSGSRLKTWFNNQGIHHADDMSGIIMQALWCKVHEKPYDLAADIKKYQDYWAKTSGPEA